MLNQTILKPFWKNKLIVLILLVEIALSFAVIANTAQVVLQRFELIKLDTGVSEPGLFIAELGRTGTSPLSRDEILQNIEAARSIPEVEEAAAVNSVPLGGGEWTVSISNKPASEASAIEVAEYVISPGGVGAFGVRTELGGSFTVDDYTTFDAAVPSSPSIVLTKHLARKLFATDKVVGRVVYVSGQPKTIIGTISELMRPSLQGKNSAQDSILLAGLPGPNLERYLIIRSSGDQAHLSRELTTLLQRVRSDQYIASLMSFGDRKRGYQAYDRYLIAIMSVASVLALLVGAFGMYALSSLWVRQRRNSMSIRRMLGASRSHILQYVLLENLAITIMGCFLGVSIAYLVNGFSMAVYQADRLSGWHLLLCTALIIIIGQLAVWRPANDVAKADPVENLR